MTSSCSFSHEQLAHVLGQIVREQSNPKLPFWGAALLIPKDKFPEQGPRVHLLSQSGGGMCQDTRSVWNLAAAHFEDPNVLKIAGWTLPYLPTTADREIGKQILRFSRRLRRCSIVRF